MTHYTHRVLEGRQIRSLQDLMDFCEAALAAARTADRTVDPDTVILDTPHDMRLVSELLTDGSKVYNIAVTSW